MILFVAGALCVCGAQKKAHGTATKTEVAKKDVAASVVPKPTKLEPATAGGCKVENCMCSGFEPNQWSAKKCAICLHVAEEHTSSGSRSPTPSPSASTTFARLALRQASLTTSRPTGVLSSSQSATTTTTPASVSGRVTSTTAATVTPTATTAAVVTTTATTVPATNGRATAPTTPRGRAPSLAMPSRAPPSTASAVATGVSHSAVTVTPTTFSTSTPSTSTSTTSITSTTSTSISTSTSTTSTSTTSSTSSTSTSTISTPATSTATTTSTATSVSTVSGPSRSTTTSPSPRTGFRAPSITAASPSAHAFVAPSTTAQPPGATPSPSSRNITSSSTVTSSTPSTPSLVIPTRTLRPSVTAPSGTVSPIPTSSPATPSAQISPQTNGQTAQLESELRAEKSTNASLLAQLQLQKQDALTVEQQKASLAAQVESLERRRGEDEQALLSQRLKSDELQSQVGHLQKTQHALEEALSLERAVASKSLSAKSREAILAEQVKTAQDKQAESNHQIEVLERKLRETEYSLSSQRQTNEHLTAQNSELQLSASQAAQAKKQEISHQQQRSAMTTQVGELESKLLDAEQRLTLQTHDMQTLKQDIQKKEFVISEGRKYDQQREQELERTKKDLWEKEELRIVQEQFNNELIAQLNEANQKIHDFKQEKAELEKKCVEAEAANVRLRTQNNGKKIGQEQLSEISDLRESLATRDRDLEEMSAIFDQMQREKDAVIEGLKKEVAQLRASPNELEPPSPRLSTSSRRRTSLALADASNYFQTNLEMSRKDFRIEELEGKLAKAEMEAQSRKHKYDQAQSKLLHMEQEHTKLLKSKDATSKELALVTKEMMGLRGRLAAASGGVECTPSNDLERESMYEEFEAGENAYAQQLMDLTVLMTNLKDSMPKLKQEIAALCACLQTLITQQVACPKGFKEARQRGEKPAMGFLATHVSTMDRLLTQYVGLLSALRTAGFQEEINRVDTSRIEIPLTHPVKLATFLQTLKDRTSAQLPGYELISSTCNFCLTKANAIQKVQEQARQSAALTVLRSKIHAIPDDFELAKNSRVLQDEALMWSILQELEEKALTHPARSREVESVRLFLFNDTILITTLEYKYRFRLELQDTHISPATALRLVLKADLFTDDDIKLNSEDDLVWPELPVWQKIDSAATCSKCAHKPTHNCRLCGYIFCSQCTIKILVPPRFEHKPNKKKSRVCLSCDGRTKRNLDLHGERGAGLLTTSDSAGAITVLQCSTTAERDLWVSKIRTTVERRKQEVGQKLVEKGKRQSILQDPAQTFTVGVRVFLRIRPFVLDVEKESGEICLTFEDNVARLEQKSLDEWRVDRVGYYDNIWGPDATQSDVYHNVGLPVIAAILSGVNCAVMCYGNTGSGKTYTMTGIGNSAKSGLIPRILEALLTDRTDCTVAAKMAYVQVYNGRVEDLLHSRADQPLELIKDKAGRYSSMYFCPILNVAQAMMSMIKSESLRATRSHNMNDLSSRSHALCILQLKITPKNGGKAREAMLQLVDLAGSENTISTGVDREGAKEAIEINKSLISLGRVVHALNENTKRAKNKQIVVPFRESPLTIILRDVLEKECLCHVVLNCSCSPALQQARQTAKTMAFGDGLRKLAAHQKS